jgi:hypothetical protein
MVNVAKAGGNLFSMDTLTGMNKYGAQALAKANAMGPNLTDEPIMSRIEIPEAPAPQMSALDAGDTTGLIAPTDATPSFGSLEYMDNLTAPATGSDVVSFEDYAVEGTIAETPIGERTSILAQPDEKGFFEKTYESGKTKLGKTVSDAPSKIFNKTFGIDQPVADEQNIYSSNVVLPDMGSTAIRTGRGMMFDPMEYASNENYFALNPYGYSAQQNNLNQLYLNELGSRVG